MTKKFIYSLLFVSISLLSCEEDSKPKLESTFSKHQKELILKGDSSDAMRVCLITNEKDSLLLRTKSEDVVFSQDSAIVKELASKMLNTVTAPENLGVGIAAPQVGILKNVILVMRYDIEGNPFEAYINPKIIKYTKLKQPCLEGCLSIPDRMDTTKTRAYAILLEYDNIKGEHKTEMIEDFAAVIFQHEIDHLNGILYLDHLDKEIRDAEKNLKFNNHLKE